MNKQAWIALTAAGFTTVALQPIPMAIANPEQVPVITELPVVELPIQTALEQYAVGTNSPFAVPPIAALPVVTFNSTALQKNPIATDLEGSPQDSTALQPPETPAYLPEPSRILGYSVSKENRPTKTSELGPLDSPEPIEIAPLPSRIPTPSNGVLQTQRGQASWYGYEAGNRTASGERYNSQALTAAHRTLAFNSRVRVTNIRNGKSVIVRINDRGPFIRGRIIDLSEAAAAAVGIKSSGVGNVQIEVLSYGSKGSKKRR